MNRNRQSVVWVLFFCMFLSMFATGQTAESAANLLDVYNVVWDAPSKDSSESMPCGCGDIGLNVWVENGDVLFYMQRSGSLAENNAYLKLGRVRMRLSPNPFANDTFRQELKLRQGHVEVLGQAVGDDGQSFDAVVRIWVEVKRPVIHVEVESDRPVHVDAAYENWRQKEDNSYGASCMTMERYPGGKIKLIRDIVEHTPDGVLFYHRNPAETIVDILIKEQGLDQYKDQIANDLRYRTFGGLMTGDGFKSAGLSDGKYQKLDFKAWKLVSEELARRHHLRVVTHIDQTETLDAWQQGLKATVSASANDRNEARKKTLDWWGDFWDRSWIMINPDKPEPDDVAWRVGRNYNLFRYQLGCNAFGEYPTKFNGGNFTFDANLVSRHGKEDLGFAWLMSIGRNHGADFRTWGGGIFTAQNQRLVYWPMLKSGDADAILPQFELYRKSLPGARARVNEHFEHDGAVYSEYNNVPGLALGFGWGWESGKYNRGEEIPLGDPRADATHAYNSVVEKGVMANKYISYHWESQIEHAYMILEYHRFTGADITQYMPFIENSVVFFNEHYRKRQKIRSGRELDENGKLVIYPSTSCESYRGATNPTDVVAGLAACLESILELDDSLLNLRDKAYYKAFFDSLPPYAYAEFKALDQWRRGPVTDKADISTVAIDFDDSNWHVINLSEGRQEIPENSSVTFRTTVDLERSPGNTPTGILNVSAIDDISVVYVNGQKVAETSQWNKPYAHQIGKYLKPGRNVISIIARNKTGSGHFASSVKLDSNMLKDQSGDRIMQPAASWKRYQNEECPQFYPLFPFNRFDLLGNDQDHMKVFRDTWKHGTFPKDLIRSWHQDGIFYARMGMTEKAKEYNTRKLGDSPRRFPTFWGPGNDWVPDHNWGGSGMIGLQEMLMQTMDKKIYLLPAWPKEWDVDFKLHAPHKTTVEGRVIDGKIIELKVTPESRRKDVVM